MDGPSSAFLLRSSTDDNPLELQGNSGISISEEWILTHGAALDATAAESDATLRFIMDLTPGELTNVPRELARDLRFQVYRDLGTIDDNDAVSRDNPRLQRHLGTVAAVWKCPLLQRTFDEFFKTWSFSKTVDRLDRLALSVFLLVRVDSAGSKFSVAEAEIPTVERALSRLLDRAVSRAPVRGSTVEIVSTPFGNPALIHSMARGVVSNVVGVEGCVIMTDAFALPGSEGSPVYVIPPNRIISGMIVAPTSWCRGEWVDYTFAANLAPCLLNVLGRREVDPRCSPITNHENVELDRGVVLVRCGIDYGTGILVDKDSGTFLTCSHVVAEAPEREILIEMNTGNYRSRASARLIYKTLHNQPYDVAVLRVNPEDLDPSLRAIRLSRGPIVQGEPVVSVGFPFFSSIRPTISSGLVSKSMNCMLTTTCCTQSGNSGGPIISRATGEMLGMVVCNAQSTTEHHHSAQPVLYPRMSMSVPAAVLREPLQQYLHTDNPDALRALRCDDALVRKAWKLYPVFVPSKL